MQIKQQIKDALVFISGEMSDYGYQVWNHFIHGNYDEKDYISSLKMRNANHKEQRTFAIHNFTRIISLEFDCSYGYAQKVIVGLFTKDKLESITNEFINDLNKIGK